MPATAENCVTSCIDSIKNSFEGFEDDACVMIADILLKEIQKYGDQIRQEVMTLAKGAGEQQAKPRFKKVTGFNVFGQDFRKNNPDKKDNAFTLIGAAWKALPDSAREEWKEKAATTNKERREAYIDEHGEPPMSNKKPVKQKRTTGYNEFVIEFRGKNKGKIDHKNMLTEAGKVWKKCTEKKQEKYKTQATALNAKYKEEFEQYMRDHPEACIHVKSSGKKVKKLKPKQWDGYKAYQAHWRANENKDGLTGKDAFTAIGAAWRSLAAAKKKKFNEDAKKEHEGFIEEFVKANPDCEWTKKNRPTTA